MYTGKFIGRVLLILVVLLGTILLFTGVMSLIWAEYERAMIL